MVSNKESKLIEKFKKLEAELVELLHIEPLDIDSTTQGVKTKIKAYIKKVNKARVIFDEYEKTAEEIEKLSTHEDGEMATAVVDLREEPVSEVAETYEDELIVASDDVKKVKKKKTKPISKEL